MIEKLYSFDGTMNLALPSNLYFGIGLCNRDKLTDGLPIDILEMILVGERLGGDKHILIADSHAKTNGFSKYDIDRIANEEKEILMRVCENLGFSRWNVLLVSEIDGTNDYRCFADSVNENNDYVRRELADMEWFRQHMDVVLKLGWVIGGSRNSDELSFDRKYMEWFLYPMSFMYLESGKTFDRKKPKAPPYFSENSENRIILQNGEKVASKVYDAKRRFGEKEQTIRGYLNFLKDIARLYEKVCGAMDKGPVEYRVQQILDRCLK